MLVRNSEYKGGTGLPWASGPSGKTSYFSEESLVLMSQELSSQRPTACSDSKEWLPKFLFYKKVWGWLLAFCEVCRERQSMISALGVQTLTPSSHFQDTKSPVLSCTWGPPVTFHVTLSREYIFSLPECEKSKSSYRSMVYIYIPMYMYMYMYIPINLTTELGASKSDYFPWPYMWVLALILEPQRLNGANPPVTQLYHWLEIRLSQVCLVNSHFPIYLPTSQSLLSLLSCSLIFVCLCL